MARQKLNMSAEERRVYNNKMHREQSKARRKKAERNAYRKWVRTIVEVVEKLGWDKTELLLGPDTNIIDAVVDELMEDDRFKITLGAKIGLKINERSKNG